MIIAKVGSGDGARAAHALSALSDLDSVEVSGDQLIIATAHGASAISPVAVTLANNSIKVSELTLRTPTLDDVFLHTTGTRMDADESEAVTV